MILNYRDRLQGKRIIAIDSETFYSAECSVQDLGNWHYCRHPDWYCYMVSAAWEGGDWVGAPEEFDWEGAHDAVWVMANAGFDLAVIERLKELNIVPAHVTPAAVVDVLDLTAYLGYPRSLASATEHLLGEKMDKTIRNNMKGKHYRDLTPEKKDAMREYARQDAIKTLRVWLEHGHKWPDWEMEVSEETRRMCTRGLPIDLDLVEKNIGILEMALWKARKKIPWAMDNPDAPVLSAKLLGTECRKAGIEPPASMAKDSEEFEEWMDLYSERFPFVQAMSDYRRINSILEKFKTIKERTKPDGWMPYSLLYFGAHTGRDSASGGFNPLNLPKTPFYFDADYGLIAGKARLLEIQDAREKEAPLPGYVSYAIDLRNCVQAPPGKVLIPVDASQIEARVTLGLAGDTAQLQRIREGLGVYEAHARDTMSYSDPAPLKKKDPLKYHTAKTRVLGLGFRCGWLKFVTFAKGMLPLKAFEDIFGAPINKNMDAAFRSAVARRSDPQGKKVQAMLERGEVDAETLRYWVNSYFQVEDFRESNPKIKAAWERLDKVIKLRAGKDFEIELPSGRMLRYRNVQNFKEVSAIIPRLGKLLRVNTHGGKLLENAAQGAARDIFMNRILEMRRQGYDVILRVYDEAVVLADAEGAEETKDKLEAIMSESPDWWKSIPLGAEGAVVDRYTK